MEIEVRPRDGLLTLASNLSHIAVFASLTFCLAHTLSGRQGGQKVPGGPCRLTLLGAGAYAALDEWHQSFVPGRHASEGDFLLDIVGIGGMLLILHLRGLREMDRLRKIP